MPPAVVPDTDRISVFELRVVRYDLAAVGRRYVGMLIFLLTEPGRERVPKGRCFLLELIDPAGRHRRVSRRPAAYPGPGRFAFGSDATTSSYEWSISQRTFSSGTSRPQKTVFQCSLFM